MATIAEKSRTKEIIDRLQGILNNASPVPLAAGKVTVYKDEIQSLLDELAMQMEAELKTYHEVNDRRGKIINEAKKEAERIIYQAEHSASRMRVSKRSTNVAPLDYSTLDEEEIASLGNANEIYAASLIYTDEMLTEVSKVVEDVYQNIRSDYEIVLQALEEKMNTIISNKNELMSGLQEMDTADRSQQILEIGQLLSNELYNERMKQRMASNVYDDGSVQLTLDLQIEQAEENARAAEALAKQTAEALEQMTEERDALMETVMQMEREQLMARRADRMAADGIQAKENSANGSEEDAEYEVVYVTEDELEEGEEYEIEYVDEDYVDEEGVEYEIVYVTEDELEEGEEYEIEYVDEDDTLIQKSPAKKTAATKQQALGESGNAEVKEAAKESGTLEKDAEGIPMIPRFKKSEKVASAPSEQIARMATAVTTEKKYSGLIGRAVANREKAEAAVTVEDTDSSMIGQPDPAAGKKEPAERAVAKPEGKNTAAETQKQPGNDRRNKETNTEASANSRKKQRREKRGKKNQPEQKDADIKTDAEGNEYVQATMQFDDDFEIMEF
ncbi:MAG: hypothetical protein NC347_06535 [Clostridium sp.]|nr:hypothetical protein [Clostridium sp.]